MAAFMAAINVGVTKTPLGSTLVVSEMAGLQLLPTTLIAAMVALILTSQVGLIHTQQERQGPFAQPSDPEPCDPPAELQQMPPADETSPPDGRTAAVVVGNRSQRSPHRGEGHENGGPTVEHRK